MKKFFISFVLIISLLFNVFADNKQAHKELREAFENYPLYSKMVKRGFNLDKLDKIDDWEEMRDYLQPIFIDENQMPLDNHAFIGFYTLKDDERLGYVDTAPRSTFIEWSDEYGSKKELLKKGYKEDEIFYYPYFNGEWRDGYRVGKKFVSKNNTGFYHTFNQNYCVKTEKALLVGMSDFKNNNSFIFDEINNSKKEYLILDLSYNMGGKDYCYNHLIDVIKKMSPKEIYILSDFKTASMGEFAINFLEKETKIKTTNIGYLTTGMCETAIGFNKKIQFDNFILIITVAGPTDWTGGVTDGIGISPDIYTNDSIESLEVVKHLIGDDALELPEKYFNNIDKNKARNIKKWR